jgi:hypothetical protein
MSVVTCTRVTLQKSRLDSRHLAFFMHELNLGLPNLAGTLWGLVCVWHLQSTGLVHDSSRSDGLAAPGTFQRRPNLAPCIPL